MLFELDVDPFSRSVVTAVVPVSLAQSDAEPFRLVELRGGQQKQHFSAQARFGSPAAQVAREHAPIDRTTRADRVRHQAAEEFFAAGQVAVQQISLAVAPHQEFAVLLDTYSLHRSSIP